jgi:anti-anti-sigma factor
MGETFELYQFAMVIEPDVEARRGSVRVSGELDIASAPTFVDEMSTILSRPIDTICVDLGMLTFIDSSGLRALDTVRRSADEQSIRLLLVSVPAQARRVLELTDMARLFEYARG